MRPPLDVSVVIPTYNRADWLPRTLASILGQTLEPMEVIVVDDGSTDGTEALARSFPPTVRYSRIENSGVCRARNAGVSLARGSWLAFCDSDDLRHPRKRGATENDRPVPIWPAYGDVQACVVEPADQRILFRFRPRSFVVGRWLSWSALLLVAMSFITVTVLGRRRDWM